MATDETSDFQRTTLARRIFAEHGITYTGVWRVPEYTWAALAIFKSGIFSGRELIAPTGKRVSVDLDDKEGMDHLLFDLVRAYLDCRIFSMHPEILSVFDQYFEWWAGIARLGGIQPRRLERLRQKFRKKISERIVEGKIHPDWMHILVTGEVPPPLAQQLVEVFLRYVPLKTPSIHIMAWTNTVLIALGEEPENENTLRLYIGRRKKDLMQAPEGPISITE